MPIIDPEQTTTIDVGGFSAHVDAYAMEPDMDAGRGGYFRKQNLWFISILGPSNAVRAIWARLVKGELATLRIPGKPYTHCTLAPEGPKQWKMHAKHIPTAAAHNLALLPEAANFKAVGRTDFLLLMDDERDAPNRYYRFLNQRVPIPLHAQWGAWLFSRAIQTGEAIRLESNGVVAYRVRPDLEALSSDLSNAVRSGLLTIREGT